MSVRPIITPLAQRLAEAAGVAWWTLADPPTTVTEGDVLAHLTEIVTGATKTQVRPADAEIDLSSLAASLADALDDLLAEPLESRSAGDHAEVADAELKGGSVAETEPGNTLESGARHLQDQLEAEQHAHTETKAQLAGLQAILKQQQLRAAQLKPLATEIRRIGSALGRANAELERLRPFEGLAGTLQGELEQARADEASARLLCRELQAQISADASRTQRRPRGFFRRRSP